MGPNRPMALGIVLFLGRVMRWLVKTLGILALGAVLAWKCGVPNATDQTANDWLKAWGPIGIPSNGDDWIYHLARALAFVLVILGWIVAAYLTVWILGALLHL